MQLMAQAVPTAAALPCVQSLPIGWAVWDARVVHGTATFIVGVGDSRTSPVTVTLTEICPPDTGDTTVESMPTEGGCVTYGAATPEGGGVVPSFGPAGQLSFVARSDLIEAVDRETGLVLCGEGAPDCEGAG
jgi:hypothetical protein